MAKKQKTLAIKNILNTATKEADESQYCLACVFSYITNETGRGYCKYQDANTKSTLNVKPIEEYDTCNHWERKK